MSAGGVKLSRETGASMSAEVTGDVVTGRLSHDETTVGVGLPDLGLLVKGELAQAFAQEQKRLFAVNLSDADVRAIVAVRVFEVASWEGCARTVGTYEQWRAVGATMRAVQPPEAWVEQALGVVRMRLLADPVAGNP